MPRRCKYRPSRFFGKLRNDRKWRSKSPSKRSMTMRNYWSTGEGSARSLRIVSNVVGFISESGSSTRHGRRVKMNSKGTEFDDPKGRRDHGCQPGNRDDWLTPTSCSQRRARSVYERALQVDSKNSTLYLKYVEMEMKHKNIALARNLFDRIVTILPRRDQFW